MRLLPEPGWWGPTTPGKWWTAQPIAHLIGGLMEAAFAMLLWWPTGGWRPVLFAGGTAAFWQLLSVEWQPDAAYQVRWAVYDTVTAMLAASSLTLLWGTL
jgi:hypothetical protein